MLYRVRVKLWCYPWEGLLVNRILHQWERAFDANSFGAYGCWESGRGWSSAL
jgi:hypothetical protein